MVPSGILIEGWAPIEDDRAADPTKWMSDEAYFWVTQYWDRLFDDPNFEQRWVDRWQELRQTVFSDANLQATLESHTSQLTAAQARNAARWGAGIAPNGGPLADPGLTGWEGEISHLENWLVARANWIDTQMISPPAFSPEAGQRRRQHPGDALCARGRTSTTRSMAATRGPMAAESSLAPFSTTARSPSLNRRRLLRERKGRAISSMVGAGP